MLLRVLVLLSDPVLGFYSSPEKQISLGIIYTLAYESDSLRQASPGE